MTKTLRLALALICLPICLAAARAASEPPLTVAAASDLQAVLPAIAARFEKTSGHEVRLTFGSSGNFYTQIQNGAPFDVFLSADIDYPRRLAQAKQAEPGSLYEYATGRLVLWTRNDSGVDLRGGLAVLAGANVHRVAIANPDHAPYGRAAVAAVRHEQLYDRVQAKFVRGENISQAAQFAQSGNAEVGILALSLALSPAMKSAGTYEEIPDSLHPPIEQAAIIVSASQQKTLAARFIEFLKRSESVRQLQAYGFALPRPAGR
ncbi:MAG TPA: molybdate ABC transporter substrate-binding protein [Vicinamibacterales bacterium]|nr:molybdate ABC transporter substrate-binding protein [Vicinamibacterales bacterium]